MSHYPNYTTALAMALTLTLTPLAGAAQGNSNNNNGNGNGNGNNGVPHNTANGQFCPPGLANRNPPCVPPGQAVKYDIGDEVETYDLVLSPELFGLNPDGTYIEDDGIIYLFDERTRAVLDIIGAISVLAN